MESQGRHNAGRLFLIAILFVAAAPVFWTRVAAHPDPLPEAQDTSNLYNVVYPAFHYGFDQLRAGHVPLWNPQQLCGTPFQADPRVSLAQPLNWFFLFTSAERAMTLNALLCLALMGMATTLFARSLGLRYLPSMIAGVAYAFSGAAASAMSRPALASALVWGPVLLWAAHEFRRSLGKGAALAVGLSAALLLLSGSMAVALAFLPIAVPYLIVAAIQPPVSHGKRIDRRDATMGIALASVVALAVSAIQWLPALAWLPQLNDPAAVFWNFSVSAQTPRGLLDIPLHMLSPRPDRLPRLVYVGILPLVIAPVALFHTKHARSVTFFAGILAGLLFVVLAFPELPFDLPRTALAIPAFFCVAVLTGIGTDRLLAPRQDFRSPPVWKAAVLTLALVTVLFLLAGGDVRGRLLAIVLALSPFLPYRTRWTAVVSGVLLAVFLYADLCEANRASGIQPIANATAALERHKDSLDAVRAQTMGDRTVTLTHALPLNVGMLSGLRVAGGEFAAMTAEQARWWRTMVPRERDEQKVPKDDRQLGNLLRAMGVRTVVADSYGQDLVERLLAHGALLREVSHGGALRVLQLDNPLPRAHWVAAWQTAYSPLEAIDLLTKTDFDPATACVVDAETGLLPAPPHAVAPPPSASCVVEETSPEHVTVRVDAPSAGIAVLSDSFAQGWHVTLDGRPVDMLRINALFRGVYTPAGAHVIQYHYRPLSFLIGAVLSAITFVVAAGAGLILVLRRLTETEEPWNS